MMAWASLDEFYKACGGAVVLGLLFGAVVALVNSWRS